MKKELKKTIYEHVSTLRNLFVKMKEKLEEGMRLKEQMDNENNTKNRGRRTQKCSQQH